MFRADFVSEQTTFQHLQKKIQEKYGIPPELQVLSLTRINKPQFITANPSDSFSKMGLRHGQILYLILANNQSTAVAEKQEKEHDHLLEHASEKSKNKSVTLQTSEWVNDPKHKVEDTGPKHIPFHEWIEDRQKKNANQPWNIDPPTFDYRPVKIGTQLEFSKLPPNAVIKRQEYRHCDVIRFMDDQPLHYFKSQWEKNPEIQRAAFLIGKYTLEENSLDVKKKMKEKNYFMQMYMRCIFHHKEEIIWESS